LDIFNASNPLLATFITSIQTHVDDLEDAMMEELDTKGSLAGPLDSLSDVDPVENMVAIPVPAPSVVHALSVRNIAPFTCFFFVFPFHMH
jgi:hypothetical protein